MAEENDGNLSENNLDENNESDNEYKVRRRINKKQDQGQKSCRTRFDVLATPHKRAILDVYQNHAHHFPKYRVERIKQKLQELYAMTPEETEKYFEQLRSEANAISKQKVMKYMLKKMYQDQERQKQERKAFQFIERLLKQGMMHAFNNAVPPLISVRLRNLSEIILEQICNLRNTDIPDRENPDQCGLFLMAVADWIAIAIEHIYYEVQLRKNEELEKIDEQAKSEATEKTYKKDKDKDTVKKSDKGGGTEKTEDEDEEFDLTEAEFA